MKRGTAHGLIRIVVYGGILLAFGGFFLDAYRPDIRDAWKRHRKNATESAILRCCQQMPPVDEVRLLRLDYRPSGKGMGTYDASYYHKDVMYIVNTATVTGEDARRLAAQWRVVKLYPESYVACFEPHHVIQFRSGGSALAEILICFTCGNATLPVFPGREIVSIDTLGRNDDSPYLALRATVEGLVGAFQK